jgi:release factor glutamine methyltransferase
VSAVLAVRDGMFSALEQWLREAAARLRQAGIETAQLDAQLIAAHVLGVDCGRLLTGSGELAPQSAVRMENLLARRLAREPLAYIIGHKEFFSLDFEVDPAVLIPRPETELVVEAALHALAHRRRARVLDLGTGSGAIAIAIAVNCRDARIVATDVSAAALAVARRNAVRLPGALQIEFREGDLFDALDPTEPVRAFDLIVSNPPYIPLSEIGSLAPEVGRYEPVTALAGGDDGMDFYRRIARRARTYLAPGGKLIVEVGAGQHQAVSELLTGAGFDEVSQLCDLAGHRRVVCAAVGMVESPAV